MLRLSRMTSTKRRGKQPWRCLAQRHGFLIGCQRVTVQIRIGGNSLKPRVQLARKCSLPPVDS